VRRTRFADGDIINVQRPDFLRSFIGGCAKLCLVSTLHGNPFSAIQQRHSMMSVAYRIAEDAGLTASHKVISVCATALAEYLVRYPFLEGKVTYIPNGVDLHKFAPRDRREARDRIGIRDSATILYAGRLDPEKRVGVLFDAVSSMRDPPTIVIAGSGQNEATIKAKARGTNAVFLGPIEHGEMPNVIAAADLVVLPSAFEGMPTIALEALACGVPVATTPVGDLPRLIVPGRTGYLFDGSPGSLRGVLEAHLENARDFREDCVRAAQPYDWERIGQRVSEVLLATS
jgi:glycosyltransferase involved in cell wall biosynthesis